jgi:hypothetical protein
MIFQNEKTTTSYAIGSTSSFEIKYDKGQKILKAIYGLLNSKTKFTILSIFSLANTQASDFLFVFWEN